MITPSAVRCVALCKVTRQGALLVIPRMFVVFSGYFTLREIFLYSLIIVRRDRTFARIFH